MKFTKIKKAKASGSTSGDQRVRSTLNSFEASHSDELAKLRFGKPVIALKMSGPPQKISLYNLNDLKNTTDDALAPYLTTLPKPYTFTQQHTLTDVRLIAGYVAVTIAGILFYADWKLGWDATKAYTAPACVAYFALNGFFTYWVWAVEAGTVFVGTREGGQKLILKSFAQKHKPIYKLQVKYEAPSGQKWEDKEVTGLYTDWFNIHGYLDKKAFRSWLAQNVQVVGLADPTSKANDDKDDGEISAEVVASVLATGIETPSSGKKKPRKKA